MKSFFLVPRYMSLLGSSLSKKLNWEVNSFYCFNILFVSSAVLILSACGNSSGGGAGGSDRGARNSSDLVPNLTFPQTLKFEGVNSETGQACVTPSVSVQNRLEYCQVLKEDSTFDSCARVQRDRLFERQACTSVIAEKLGSSGAGNSAASTVNSVVCRAVEAKEVESVGIARLFDRSAVALNAQAQVVRPGSQGGRQILRSRVGSRSIVVDQVSGTGAALQARLSILADADIKGSFTARLSSVGMFTMTDFDGHQMTVECLPSSSANASTRAAQIQPHFPAVSLKTASSEISSELKLKCEGRVRATGSSSTEALDVSEIDVLEVIDGDSVALFDKNGIQIFVTVAGAHSTKPYYQIRAEGLGKDSQYVFETAGELNRPQTLEIGGRQNSATSARVEVTCRPQK